MTGPPPPPSSLHPSTSPSLAQSIPFPPSSPSPIPHLHSCPKQCVPDRGHRMPPQTQSSRSWCPVFFTERPGEERMAIQGPRVSGKEIMGDLLTTLQFRSLWGALTVATPQQGHLEPHCPRQPAFPALLDVTLGLLERALSGCPPLWTSHPASPPGGTRLS